jgi:head-tail adaptor
MRGRNVRCRLEQPMDTRTATGGTTRKWSLLPEFGGTISPISAQEQALFDRETVIATEKLLVMGRSIPEQHREKVKEKNRITIRNRRNSLDERTYDIISVKRHRLGGRISRFDITLGDIK